MLRLITILLSILVLCTACGGGSKSTVATTPAPVPVTPLISEPTPELTLEPTPKANHILVFSKTAGFRHDAIPAGQTMLQVLGDKNNWQVTLTEDSSKFNRVDLAQYAAVIWLNTTGDVLNTEQQSAFESYIESGGGYVGIHAASDTEYSWPWYGDLVGAYFKSHPQTQQAKVHVEDNTHLASYRLNETWERTDEWYNFQENPRVNVNVLLSLDENSYSVGADAMGDHPIAWYNTIDQGRSFYTGLGHTIASYSEQDFIQHIEGAIAWAGVLPLSTLEWTGPAPLDSQFSTKVLGSSMNQPQELDISKAGEIYVIGRLGQFYAMVDDTLTETSSIPVNAVNEGGLIGFALDPNFSENRYAYFHYTDASLAQQNVSRIPIKEDHSLDLGAESVLFTYPVQLSECCHTAGSMAFDTNGNLYIATGDNTNPFASAGYTPIDEQPGRSPWDAQKSSSNTNDLRGKILRITPTTEGDYSIPTGNLFTENAQHRAEIYTMGHRNPYRITIDPANNTLVWGDIGPDAGSSNPNRGPSGVDEINKTLASGNFGWPYFTGDNNAYNDHNFSTITSGDKFDPQNVVNNSPNNTGATELPNAKPSWITLSHRALMVADVYRFDPAVLDKHKLPSYFDGKLLYWNFNNDRMFEASIDEESPTLRPWLDTSVLAGIIDGKISPHNNRFYLISFGGNCCGKPTDAGLLVEVNYEGTQENENLSNDPSITSYAINAGGDNYTAKNGIQYQADKFFSGGNLASSSNVIAGTEDDTVYQSHHWQSGNLSYALPIRNGRYQVTLQFAETFHSESGKRVFNVDAENTRIINRLDLIATATKDTAYDHVFSVEVTDGLLNLNFSAEIDSPIVSGIRVNPLSLYSNNTQLLLIASENGQYLGRNPNTSQLSAMFERALDEQTFVVEEDEDGFVRLRSITDNQFIIVAGDGSLTFSSSATTDNSLFLILQNENGTFSIQSKSNSLYIALDLATQTLHASHSDITAQSEFSISTAEPCELGSGFAIECRPNAKAYLDMPAMANEDFSNVPALLSATGAFTDTAQMTPSVSLIPYQPIATLWSDRAEKLRWVSIPSGEKVVWSEHDKWQWPAGTVFVKHFALPIDVNAPETLKRLETRLLVVRENGLLYGVTYKWRDDNSDAELLTTSVEEVVDIISEAGASTQTWTYPSPGDCLICHNVEAKGILGAKTASLNSDFVFPSGNTNNQLAVWNNLNIFAEPLQPASIPNYPAHANISDTSKTLEHRVRSYWDINCASCHGPQGIAAQWDARYETALSNQGVIHGELANQRDYLGDYGLSSPYVVEPKNADNSILYIRDKSINPDDRMPPLGRALEDKEYIEVLKQWIDSLE